MVVALTKDPTKREGLKEALGVSGWWLQSEEEWAKEIREAEGRGWREATLGAGPVDIEPLVLKEVPKVRTVSPVFPPCPPDCPTSPAVLWVELADPPSTAAISVG